jgi:hypothetical protein
VAWGDFARARYRALLTTVSYRRDTTLRLTFAHTLASALADWDVESTPIPAAFATNFYALQRMSGDGRHRFVVSGSWMMPYGVALSTVATAASPRPYRAWVGQDVNSDNVLQDDWIDGRRYVLPANNWDSWYRNVDVRISKSIVVSRGRTVSLIAEAFNLFNTENYSGYFGVQRSSTGEPRPDFGSPSGSFATRQLQFGTRLQF